MTTPGRSGARARSRAPRLAVIALLVALGLALAPSARAVTVQQWKTPAPGLVDQSTTRDQAGDMVTNVVLPDHYASRGCWPVLYLLHGSGEPSGAQEARQWLTLGGGALARMRIPAIIVIPGSGNSWYVNNWFGGDRTPAFESWMLHDIVPLTARRLHICAGRSQHAIAGLSMGGYGAVYLATQLPGYFGSAGSFSGVLSPQALNFRRTEQDFGAVWGPAGRFYAAGHDPVALVDNLRHTRVFVGVGDGVATTGEPPVGALQFEETEFQEESILFSRTARRAGVAVTLDQHAGNHQPGTWLRSLQDMLAWNPFAPVPAHPRNWTYSTVSSTGSAWGYRFAFPGGAPPSRVIQLRRSGTTLQVLGAGTVTITTPSGRRFSGRIPFAIRHGHLVSTPRAPAPHLRGGYQHPARVRLSVGPADAGTTTPLSFSFTAAALPRGDQYQLGVFPLIDTTGPCSDVALSRIGTPAPGQTVTATLAPPASGTDPGHWCPGRQTVGVSVVHSSDPATVPGTIVGLVNVTIG